MIPAWRSFAGNLALVNGMAERSPGFVWRYVDDNGSGNATVTRPFTDPKIIVNLSVWESIADLDRLVWQTAHKRFYGRRADWFEHFEGPAVALWWVPSGHRPSVEEAVARFEHLKRHGPSDHAFDWQRGFAQLWKTARCARLQGRWRSAIHARPSGVSRSPCGRQTTIVAPLLEAIDRAIAADESNQLDPMSGLGSGVSV